MRALSGLRLGVLLGSVFSAASLSAEIEGAPRFAQLEGAKIHYTDYGAGENALVLVHGWNCDETFWAGQASALGGKFHVITIDLLGHGQSDKPRIAYTMERQARAIDAVLSDAKVKAAVLAGHSNGTPVIRQFYRKFSGKTRGLVIVDGSLRPLGDNAMMEKFIAPLRGPEYEAVVGRFAAGMVQSIQDPALREKIKNAMLRAPQHVAVSELEGLLDPELWRPDKITVPVLMILAKQPSWTPEYERFVRDLVPGVDYRVWEGVSHFLMMEKPEEFNTAVSEFIEKHRLLKG
jgi:pimeloyl-ACP methyl ester carboxylesterase